MNRLLHHLLRNALGKGIHRPVSSRLSYVAIAGFPISQYWSSFAGIRSGVPGTAGTPMQLRRIGSETLPAAENAPLPRFRFTRDVTGTWILTGIAGQPAVHFSDLAVAISYARQDADAAEADIELWADGFYVFVHQTEGWPHRICAPTNANPRPIKR